MINKKIKFRTLSILLILMLCASLLAGVATPVYGDSEEPVTFTEDGFTYQITKEAEKEVAITKYVGTDTTLSIPRVVTHENEVYKITSIGRSAFISCTSLQTIDLVSVTKIGDNAFYGCSNLNTVTLSKDLKKNMLGNYAFTECGKLTTINVEEGSSDFKTQDSVLYALSEAGELETLVFCPVNTSGNFIVPGTVKTIASSAFDGCRNLTEIKLNENLEVIEDWVFANCTDLKTLHIPSTMPALGSYCFNGCTSLESITVATGNHDLYAVDGVLYDRAFDGHTALRCYPAGKTGTEYTVAEGTAEIADSAFFGNPYLEKVVVGSEVTEIEADAFSGCTSLKEIQLPQGLTSLGENCFAGCSSLEELLIPKGVYIVSLDTYESCSSLKQITIYSGTILFGSKDFNKPVLILCDSADQLIMGVNIESTPIYRAVRTAAPSAYIAKGTQYDLEKLLSMTDTIYEGPTGTDVYTGEDIKLPLYMEGNKSDDTILSGRTLTVGAGEWGNLDLYPYTTKENIQLRFPSPVIPVEPDKPDVNVEKKPDGSTITTTTEKDAKTGVESRTEVVKDKNGKTTASVQITAPAKTVTSDGTTTAEVSKAAADKLVEQAKAAEKAAADAGAKKVISTITLEASAGSEGETAAKVEIVMPTDVIKQIAEQTEADLKVVTSAGEIILDNKALAKVAEEAEGETLKLIVEKVKKEALPKAVRAKIDEKTMVLDFCAETSAGKISSFGGGKVTISLEIPETITGSVKVMHLDDKGRATEVKGKIVTNGGRRFYQFTINHFSYYAVADAKTVDRAVAATAKEKNAKIKKGVQATTIKASSKSGKGYIRVNWKKSYGYKVDGFQVFRATKSKGKYTRIWTGKGTAKTVKNSKNLKKDVRYYYKVRGFRKVDGKTIYTRWSNKTQRIAR